MKLLGTRAFWRAQGRVWLDVHQDQALMFGLFCDGSANQAGSVFEVLPPVELTDASTHRCVAKRGGTQAVPCVVLPSTNRPL